VACIEFVSQFYLLSNPPPAEYPSIPVTKTIVLDPWLEPLPSPGPAPYTAALSSHAASVANSIRSLSSDNTVVWNPMNDKIPSSHLNPELLVMNSQVFSLWNAHFARLKEVVDKWEPRGRILTLVRSRHVSFSDFHLLPLVRTSASRKLIWVTGTLALAFLDGRLSGSQVEVNTGGDEGQAKGRRDWELKLEREGVCPREVEIVVVGVKKDGKERRKFVGDVGDVIVH